MPSVNKQQSSLLLSLEKTEVMQHLHLLLQTLLTILSITFFNHNKHTRLKTALHLVRSNPTFFEPLVAAFVATEDRAGYSASAATILLSMAGI